MTTTVTKENLDERIERIRRRNEEIEKKYREAEEDRLMALKDNAMVKTKPPKDEDWPKGHKYDHIDFTYDVKPEKLEELNKQKKDDASRISKRDYKKFADGEGPPPDPVYNFLADAERDGIVSFKNDKKDSRQNSNGNTTGAGGNNKNKDNHNNQQYNSKRGGPNNNSFRGTRGNGGANNKNHSPKYQKQNSHPEYEQWRNEREKIDEARINRQKIGDGKWKREWDNDKINAENEALLRPERITLNDAFSSANVPGIMKKGPMHIDGPGYHLVSGGIGGGKMNRQNSIGHNFINAADCLVEKRGNITVSVSQTGEVKSVKLTSAPAIGTGRVGPRQISKPQFSIQTIEREVIVQPAPLSPRPQNKNPIIQKSNMTTMMSNNNVISNNNSLQKVPNKIVAVNGNIGSVNAALAASPNVNSSKIKKDKKHSPKQAQAIIHRNNQQQTQLIQSSGIESIKSSISNQIVNQQSIQQVQVQYPTSVSNKYQNKQQQQQQKQQQQVIHQSHNVQGNTTLQKIQPTTPSTTVLSPTALFVDKLSSSAAAAIPLPSSAAVPLQSTTAMPLSSSTAVPVPSSAAMPLPVSSEVTATVAETTPINTSSPPLTANEIIPIVVDLSHKPEFAKKSIQDRLLRVRQMNNSNSNGCTVVTQGGSGGGAVAAAAGATKTTTESAVGTESTSITSSPSTTDELSLLSSSATNNTDLLVNTSSSSTTVNYENGSAEKNENTTKNDEEEKTSLAIITTSTSTQVVKENQIENCDLALVPNPLSASDAPTAVAAVVKTPNDGSGNGITSQSIEKTIVACN